MMILSSNRVKRTLTLIIIVLCQACSSDFIAKTLYNNLDDIYADSVNDYARFDKDQRQIIDAAAKDFAKWHRATQLAQYQQAVKGFSRLLDAPVSAEQIRALGTTMEVFGEQMSDYAWPKLLPLFDSISQKQVLEMETVLAEELEEWQKDSEKRHNKGTGEEPNKENLKEIRKIFRRALGVKLSRQQSAVFEPLLEQSKPLELAAMELEREWNAELIDLLLQKDSATSHTIILEHMLAGSRLLRDNYPAEVEANTQTFSRNLATLLNSLDNDQRGSMRRRLAKYDQLLETLINDR